MSSSSSSDSDSAEKAKLKDAAIDVGTILDMTAPKEKSFQNKNFASSSRRDQSSSHRNLDLDTTAEFRSFVAMKLYESLERRIKFKKLVKKSASDAKEENKRDVPSDWGFRLFSSSVSNSRTEIAPKSKKRIRSKSTSSDSDSRETLASAAVDLQTILDDSTMLNRFRAKEKKSVETYHTQQTEQSVRVSTNTNDQPKERRKDKKKTVKADKGTATL